MTLPIRATCAKCHTVYPHGLPEGAGIDWVCPVCINRAQRRERVAIALAEDGGGKWSTYGPQTKEWFLALADAAIGAMRNPTCPLDHHLCPWAWKAADPQS